MNETADTIEREARARSMARAGASPTCDARESTTSERVASQVRELERQLADLREQLVDAKAWLAAAERERDAAQAELYRHETQGA